MISKSKYTFLGKCLIWAVPQYVVLQNRDLMQKQKASFYEPSN